MSAILSPEQTEVCYPGFHSIDQIQREQQEIEWA
jgi:hypothetical protein